MDVKDMIKDGVKSIKKLIGFKVIIAIALVVIVFGACVLVIDKVIVEASAESIQRSLNTGTKLENNQIIIEDSVYEEIFNELKEKGLDPEGLYLDPSQGYIQKYVQAEVVTSYPRMGTEGTQGIINFIRRDANADEDTAGTLMTYMPYDEFNSIVNEQSASAFERIKNCFSLDMTTMDAIVASYTSISGSESSYSISIQKIAYKNQVAKYTVPFEFLISLLQVSRNPEFVVSLADMVINNSKINYTIQDCISDTTTTVVYTYDEVTLNPEYDADNKLVKIDTNTANKTEDQGSTTTKVNSILPYISEVDTWIVNITQYYNKSATPVSNSSVEELDNETISSNVYRMNRKITTTEIGEVIKYVGGVSVSGESPNIVNSTQFSTTVSAVGKVAKIVDWAEQQVGKTQYMGKSGISIARSYCAKFVSNCYWAAGFTYLGGNANAMSNLGTHYSIERNSDGTINYTNIPIGACIVSLEGTYGHVVIYVGNGYVVEAGVSPIRKVQIDKAWKSNSYSYWALRKGIRTVYGFGRIQIFI